ncbi:MarR family winged helix-turn-helix transcriptional regulator [Microbispora sp. H10836]|uniref:MarR family winged helix-turn-helix transcriptional regulator n=1 Tax=Microbispora sp. H10836 TaxID=2729106 RepID=UPI0014736255|nr:MarR family transcriptional regulator [Microbispora sp. H10836]
MEENAAVEEISRLYPAVHRRLRTSGRLLPGRDLTARMVSVLRHLMSYGPLTVGDLAGRLRLSRAATTELLDRVESRGLVARTRDQRDRRRVYVRITEAGRAAAAAGAGRDDAGRDDDPLTAAVRTMTPQERQGLVDGLRALLRERPAGG